MDAAFTYVEVEPDADTPDVDFTYTPESPGTNDTVTFEVVSGGDAKYSWRFGNETARGETATTTFSTRGAHVVTLTATYPDGDEVVVQKGVLSGADEYERRIPIGSPVAAFGYTPDAPSTGETVSFNASRSSDEEGEVVKYEWDIDGDGSFERSGMVVEEVFEEPGNYSVTLGVVDMSGATNTTTERVRVGEGEGGQDGGPSGPLILAVVLALAVVAAVVVVIKEGGLDGMRWAGILVLAVVLLLSVPSVSAQSVSVNASVNTTGVEDGDTITLNVSVNATDPVYEGVGLNVTPPSGWVLTPVDNDSGSVKQTGGGSEWGWLNNTGTVRNITADVTVPTNQLTGNYVIEAVGSAVNVSPSPSVRETASDSVTINVSGNLPPNASFDVSPASPVEGEVVRLDATSSTDSDGNISSYSWDFGDGDSSTGATVTHTYTDDGTFNATLTVVDDGRASDTVTRAISVDDRVPPPDGTGGDSSGGAGVGALPDDTDTDTEDDETGEPPGTEDGDGVDSEGSGGGEDEDTGREPEFEFSMDVSSRSVGVLSGDDVPEESVTTLTERVPGETITVDTEVRNVGSVSGSTEARLMVNGRVIDTERVSLEAGESTNLEFVVGFGEPGEYEVRVSDSEAVSVNVTGEEEPAPVTFVVGVVAALILLLAILGSLLYRRMGEEEASEES